MSGPYNILPGSAAADAVNEIASIELTPDNAAQEVRRIVEKHGVDKMTSSAVERAMEQLASNPNVDLKSVAKDIVGASVANPEVAARSAQQQVANLPKNATDEQKQSAALNAAEQSAIDAGADGPAARKKAQALMDQGVAPEQAARLATLSVVAPAVGTSPDATGYEIYGYLTAHVTDYVSESYLATETRHVTGVAEHTYDNSLVLTTPKTLHIKCADYLAEANKDTSSAFFSSAIYVNGYHIDQISPRSWTGASISIYGAGLTAIPTTSFSGAYSKTFLNAYDLFAVLFTLETPKKKSHTHGKADYKTKIGIWLSKFSVFK